MDAVRIKHLRATTELSRRELGQFLGVTEMTMGRWEDPRHSRPRGLPKMLLDALYSALQRVGPDWVRRVVLLATHDHRRAIQDLLNLESIR